MHNEDGRQKLGPNGVEQMPDEGCYEETVREVRVLAPPARLEAAGSLLSFDEAAQVLRCSRRTVERRGAAGDLEIVRNGRRRLVTQASLRSFIARNTYISGRKS